MVIKFSELRPNLHLIQAKRIETVATRTFNYLASTLKKWKKDISLDRLINMVDSFD